MAVDLSKLTAAVGSKDHRLLGRLTRKFKGRLAEIDEAGDQHEDEVVEGKPVDQAELEDRGAELYRLLVETAETTGRSVKDLLQKPTKALRDKSAAVAELMDYDLTEDGPTSAGTARDGGKPRATAADALGHLIMGHRRDRRVGFKYGCVFECLCRHFGRELGHDRWYDLRRGSSWFRELDGVLRAAGVPARTFSIRRHLRDRGPPVRAPRYSASPAIGYLKGPEIQRASAALGRADLASVDELARQYLADVRDWLKACANSKRDLVCFYG